MKDISEEAKQAIANGALVRARQRLARDGCHTNAAMQRRVLLLAAERNLPPAEYAKLMHKRVLTGPLLAFCKKHDVSLDWLMDGDLKGLQRMTLEAKAVAAGAPTVERLMKKYSRLTPEHRRIVEEEVDRLLKGVS
jgi:hypothetical protein